MPRKRPANHRSELLRELDEAGRAWSTAAVLFHGALAARQGLTASETKALDLLVRFGPLTAGALGERSGLAPASVTGLVDRLERKGFARRVRDPGDGRRVLVEADLAALAGFAPDFVDFTREMHALYADYTAEQLTTILHFIREATRRQAEATTRLAAAPPVSAAPRRSITTRQRAFSPRSPARPP